MADATNKDVIKAIENLTGTMSKLMSTQGKNVSVGRTPNSEPHEKKSSGARLYTQLEKEIKKPETPFKKAVVKMLETTWGRAVGQMIVHVKTYTQDYYRRMTSVVSGLANKIFGSVLSELDPFIEAIKATGSYLFNMLKTLPKFMGLMKNTIMSTWDGFKKVGERVFGLFKPKSTEDKKDKELKKQTSIERKILLTQGKIIRWLTYIEKNTGKAVGGVSAYGAAKTNRWIKRYGRNMGSPDGGEGTPTPQPEQRGLIKSVVGTIWGGLSGAAKWAGSVVMGVFKTISNVGGLIGGMVPYIGPLLGPLLAIGLPLLLGSTLFKGVWDWFKQTTPGKWVDENMIQPFVKYWDTTMKPKLIETAEKIGGVIANVIREALKPESAKEADKQVKKAENLSQDLYQKGDRLRGEIALLDKEGKTEEASEKRRLLKQVLSAQMIQSEVQKKAEEKQNWEMYAYSSFYKDNKPDRLGTWDKIFKPTQGIPDDPTKAITRKKGGPVPIMAHEGEYVMRREAVDKYGMGKMNLINSGKLPMFQQGGSLDLSSLMKSGDVTTKQKFAPTTGAGKYTDLVNKYSKKYGVDPNLIKEIMRQESSFSNPPPHLERSGWVYGPMQLLESTARGMGFDPKNEEQNIEAGVKYFAKQLKAFNGNVSLALAAYNAGPGRVKGGKVPEIRQTQNYVKIITSRYGKVGGTSVASIAGIPANIGTNTGTDSVGTGDSFMDFVSSIWDMTKAIGSALWEQAFGPDELMGGADTSQGKNVITAEAARSQVPTLAEAFSQPTTTQNSPTVINQIDNSSVGGGSSAPHMSTPADSMLGIISKVSLLQINTSNKIY